MIIEKENYIYLDANFLVHWAYPKTDDIKRRIRILLAKIMVKKYRLASSCLALDEMWYSVKKEYNKSNNAAFNCSGGPIFNLLNKFTDQVLRKVALLQFADCEKGTKDALSNIGIFDLRPRDAFHLSLMQNNLIDKIATNDNDFIKVESLAGIKIIR